MKRMMILVVGLSFFISQNILCRDDFFPCFDYEIGQELQLDYELEKKRDYFVLNIKWFGGWKKDLIHKFSYKVCNKDLLQEDKTDGLYTFSFREDDIEKLDGNLFNELFEKGLIREEDGCYKILGICIKTNGVN